MVSNGDPLRDGRVQDVGVWKVPLGRERPRGHEVVCVLHAATTTRRGSSRGSRSSAIFSSGGGGSFDGWGDGKGAEGVCEGEGCNGRGGLNVVTHIRCAAAGVMGIRCRGLPELDLPVSVGEVERKVGMSGHSRAGPARG